MCVCAADVHRALVRRQRVHLFLRHRLSSRATGGVSCTASRSDGRQQHQHLQYHHPPFTPSCRYIISKNTELPRKAGGISPGLKDFAFAFCFRSSSSSSPPPHPPLLPPGSFLFFSSFPAEEEPDRLWTGVEWTVQCEELHCSQWQPAALASAAAAERVDLLLSFHSPCGNGHGIYLPWPLLKRKPTLPSSTVRSPTGFHTRLKGN